MGGAKSSPLIKLLPSNHRASFPFCNYKDAKLETPTH